MSESPPYLGRVIDGRYRVEEVIGRGGMGAVYLARHVHLKKRVALKFLLPDAENLDELTLRFEREAVAGAHVTHPNVATATDFGELPDGARFLVMEYARGVSLRNLLRDEVLTPERAAGIARQIALGLAAIHDKGIVHRDLKPLNVMVDPKNGDAVKIIDFGVAKVREDRFSSFTGATSGRAISEEQRLTGAGVIFGTIAYLAPEAALGMDAIGPPADLYALGLMLYEMLTGKHPFDAIDPGELFAAQCTLEPPPFVERAPERSISPVLEAITLRLLQKTPEARYPSARDVVEAFERVLPTRSHSEPVPPPLSSIPPLGDVRVPAIPSAPPLPRDLSPPVRPAPAPEVPTPELPPPNRPRPAVAPPLPEPTPTRSPLPEAPAPPSSSTSAPLPPPNPPPRRSHGPLPKPRTPPKRSTTAASASAGKPRASKPGSPKASRPEPPRRSSPLRERTPAPADTTPTSTKALSTPEPSWLRSPLTLVAGAAVLGIVALVWSRSSGSPQAEVEPATPSVLDSRSGNARAAAPPSPPAVTAEPMESPPASSAAVDAGAAADMDASADTDAGGPSLTPAELGALRNRIGRYAASKAWGPAALALVELAAADPAAFADAQLVDIARRAAIASTTDDPPSADALFDVLATRLGSAGPDVLLSIVENGGTSTAAKRAAKLMRSVEVHAIASEATRVAFALRDSPCNEKLDHLGRAVEHGDHRALVALEISVRPCFTHPRRVDEAIDKLRDRLEGKSN